MAAEGPFPQLAAEAMKEMADGPVGSPSAVPIHVLPPLPPLYFGDTLSSKKKRGQI